MEANMRSRTSTALAAAGSLVLIFRGSSLAQFDQYGRWQYHEDYEPAMFTYAGYTREQADELVDRWGRIGAKGDDLAWAGEYQRGFSELGASFPRFDAEHGYVRLSTHSCMPDVREFDYGAVEEQRDRVHLRPAGPLGTPATLVKVTWGERRYLVEEERIEEFAKFASGRRVLDRDECPEDSYFVHASDLERAISGVPSFPGELARYAKEPISATATRVSHQRLRGSSIRIAITLDRGRSDGVARGMRFYTKAGDSLCSVRVEATGGHWCRASVEDFWSADSLAEAEETYAPGAVWTTCIACVW
jgi:hypothetical protein